MSDSRWWTRRRLLEFTLASPASVAAAQEHAHGQSQSPSPRLRTLRAEEAREIEAIAAQVIPSGDTPGAREAGVIYFIDYALTHFDRGRLQACRDGLRMAQASAGGLLSTECGAAGALDLSGRRVQPH